MIRVAPNELSFASAASWQAIYGVPPPGQPVLRKSEFYDIFGAGFGEACIGSERDPQEHTRKKKTLVSGFAPKALHAQGHIVQQVWDRFIDKIGPASWEGPRGVNIVSWLEMATFDALGEMAFGESFGCLDNGESCFSWSIAPSHSLMSIRTLKLLFQV